MTHIQHHYTKGQLYELMRDLIEFRGIEQSFDLPRIGIITTKALSYYRKGDRDQYLIVHDNEILPLTQV
ncbi:unnamed protein product, partial [marine sediment metagenome]